MWTCAYLRTLFLKHGNMTILEQRAHLPNDTPPDVHARAVGSPSGALRTRVGSARGVGGGTHQTPRPDHVALSVNSLSVNSLCKHACLDI